MSALLALHHKIISKNAQYENKLTSVFTQRANDFHTERLSLKTVFAKAPIKQHQLRLH